MTWACRCHERPYVHRAVALPFTQADYGWAMVQAQKMARTYERSGASDYEPNPRWTYRGPLAERVLAHHFKLWHTPYHDVGEPKVNAPYDVEKGIEMRATGHWRIDRQNEFCISLMPKDRRKLAKPDSIWVLASVRDATSEVLYWGFRMGPSIRLDREPFKWETKYGTKWRIALVYPDELAPAATLWGWLKKRVTGRVDYPCGCALSGRNDAPGGPVGDLALQ